MATSPSSNRLLELEANATTPHGATIRLTVEYRIRPSDGSQPGLTYEDVSMKKTVDVNMGTNGQYKQEATYQYGSETDLSTRYSTVKPSTVIVPSPPPPPPTPPVVVPTVINKSIITPYEPDSTTEHISEDEKSVSSEEAFYEEWSEEFRCRRTDEYDPDTHRLLRSDIIETGERHKSDVLKEEYKGKNVRIKPHKTYGVAKQINQTSSTNTIVPPIMEETIRPPPSLQIETTTSSLPKQDQQWTSEEIYTTEVVVDSKLAKEIESNTQKFDLTTPSKTYDRVLPARYSPMPSTTQAIVSTSPSSHYEQISTVVTPTVSYAEPRRQEPEQFISEEYHVEVQSEKAREVTSEDDNTNQDNAIRRNSDWRSRLRQIYAPASDDGRVDQTDTRDTTISSPPRDDDRRQSPKYSSTTFIDESQRTPQRQRTASTDRPTFGRVGELKNTFETTRTSYVKDDNTSKSESPIRPGITEERRRIFEDREQTNAVWERQPVQLKLNMTILLQ